MPLGNGFESHAATRKRDAKHRITEATSAVGHRREHAKAGDEGLEVVIAEQ